MCVNLNRLLSIAFAFVLVAAILPITPVNAATVDIDWSTDVVNNIVTINSAGIYMLPADDTPGTVTIVVLSDATIDGTNRPAGYTNLSIRCDLPIVNLTMINMSYKSANDHGLGTDAENPSALSFMPSPFTNVLFFIGNNNIQSGQTTYREGFGAAVGTTGAILVMQGWDAVCNFFATGSCGGAGIGGGYNRDGGAVRFVSGNVTTIGGEGGAGAGGGAGLNGVGSNGGPGGSGGIIEVHNGTVMATGTNGGAGLGGGAGGKGNGAGNWGGNGGDSGKIDIKTGTVIAGSTGIGGASIGGGGGGEGDSPGDYGNGGSATDILITGSYVELNSGQYGAGIGGGGGYNGGGYGTLTIRGGVDLNRITVTDGVKIGNGGSIFLDEPGISRDLHSITYYDDKGLSQTLTYTVTGGLCDAVLPTADHIREFYLPFFQGFETLVWSQEPGGSETIFNAGDPCTNLAINMLYAQPALIFDLLKNITVGEGDSATFSIQVSGGIDPYDVRWQCYDEMSGSWEIVEEISEVDNDTICTYTIPVTTYDMNGSLFKVKATDRLGRTCSSGEAKLTVTLGVSSITTQPQNVTVTEPNPATFSVVASSSDGNIDYLWQYYNRTISQWLPISVWDPSIDCQNSTLVIDPTNVTTHNNSTIRVQVTNAAGIINSTNATLYVNPPIEVTVADVTAAVGDSATFTATVKNGTPSFEYQWQKWNGIDYDDITGATGATYTITSVTAADDQTVYRVFVKDSGLASEYSNDATLTVIDPLAFLAGSGPLNVTVYEPTVGVFNVNVTGGVPDYSYQWQVSKNNGATFANVVATDGSGGTTDTFTTSATDAATMNGYLYRVIVTDNASSTLTSNAATLTVLSGLSFDINLGDVVVNEPNAAVFIVNVSGGSGNNSYEWYGDQGSGTFTQISGENNTSLTINPTNTGMTGYRYYVIVTDNDGGASLESDKATLTVLSELTVTLANVIVNEGTPAVFNASVSGGSGNYSYAWYQDAKTGTFVQIPGESNDSLTISSTNTGMDGYKYYVHVTDDDGTGSADSNAATLTVLSGLSFSVNLANVTVYEPYAADFIVNVTGGSGNYTYAWYEDDGSGSGFTLITGVTGAPLTISPTNVSMTGNKYYVVVTDNIGSGAITSNEATLTVLSDLSFDINLGDVTVTEPDPAVFNVSVSGGSGNYSYAWYLNTSGTPSLIAGETNDSLQIDPTNVTTHNGSKYYVVVTDNVGASSIQSDDATLTVLSGLSYTVNLVNITVNEPNPAVFNVSVSGGSGNYSYAWYLNTSGTPSLIVGETNDSLQIDPTNVTTHNGSKYYVVVTDNVGAGSIQSNDATLTVNPTLEFLTGSGPDDVIVNEPTTATFSVGVSGGTTFSGPLPYAYQWQVSKDGTNYTDVTTADGTGGNTATFTTVATDVSMSGYKYRVIVTDNISDSITSAAANLTVNYALEILSGSGPDNVTVNEPMTATFNVTAANGTPPYSYQWQVDDGSGFVDVTAADGTGGNNDTFTTIPTDVSMSGYKYRVIVTDNISDSVTSDEATLTVNYALDILTGSGPNDTTVIRPRTATFRVVAANGTTPYSYQWYVDDGTGSGFVPVVDGVDGTGGTTANFTTVATTLNMSGYQYHVVVTDATLSNLTSRDATLTVRSGGGTNIGNATIRDDTPANASQPDPREAPTTAMVVLKIVDADDPTKFLDATLEIKDANGNSLNPRMTIVTRNGTVTFDLEPGTYRLYGVTLPDGYRMLTDYIDIVVNEDLTIRQIDGLTQNSDETYELTLPLYKINESNNNRILLIIAGLILLVLLALLIAFAYMKYFKK